MRERERERYVLVLLWCRVIGVPSRGIHACHILTKHPRSPSLFPEDPAMRVPTPRQPSLRLLWRHGLGASGFSEVANQRRLRTPQCLWLVGGNFIENLLRYLLDVARASKGRSSPPGLASGGHSHWSSVVSTLTIVSCTQTHAKVSKASATVKVSDTHIFAFSFNSFLRES